MLAPNLETQVLQFVRTFYVVRLRQIRKFFSDWGASDVDFFLTNLLSTNQLTLHDEQFVSVARHLPQPVSYYYPCMDAIDVMVMLRSQNVTWMGKLDFPTEILFVTTDNEVYDVTVFDDLWATKYSLIPRTRNKCLPPGESDPVKHVAVVPDEGIANAIDELGFFWYAIVDRDTGFVDLFNLNG